MRSTHGVMMGAQGGYEDASVFDKHFMCLRHAKRSTVHSVCVQAT